LFTLPHPPRSTLFPYTTLFRSYTNFTWRATVPASDRSRTPSTPPLGNELESGAGGGLDFKSGGKTTCSGRTTRLSQNSVIVRTRSEEHTSELQSQSNLVCRLLL